ncbi:unnamed protein product [Sphenostylis stenocarpa]|uniref:Uncharacterized protein n=1 Tax=Sphenostylis stenocarpa TaxID=92480 RepID=A0AA86TEV3_9FABA|nr:unnamed protein product [Sphenostylis stenocarpa]
MFPLQLATRFLQQQTCDARAFCGRTGSDFANVCPRIHHDSDAIDYIVYKLGALKENLEFFKIFLSHSEKDILFHAEEIDSAPNPLGSSWAVPVALHDCQVRLLVVGCAADTSLNQDPSHISSSQAHTASTSSFSL